jgi:ketosteroid isomerase-like protein
MREERTLIEPALRMVSEADAAGLAAIVHPEFEFSSIFTPMEGVYRGVNGVRAYLDELRESFETYELTLLGVEPVGDEYLVELRAHGRGRGSGIELDLTACQVWTFRDGLILRVSVYPTVEEARAALGLDT